MKKVKITKKFLNMKRREAVAYIFSEVERVNELESWSVNEVINYGMELSNAWNKEQTCLKLLTSGEKGEASIEVYELWEDEFNDAATYGLGVEDDYIIFREYREEYEAWREEQLFDNN